ncbi:replication initiator [Streptomyces scopuliridis]|uniref:replication initiator n=1 Tax=Streptomyces scopuliridis TaxID=452529 RepID=UPI0036CE4CB4
MLADSVRAAAARVRVTVVWDAVGERELAWGEQLDVREIATSGTDDELTDQAVAAYVAKYATKSADASGPFDHALHCRPCQGRGATLLATEPRSTAPPAAAPNRPGPCPASPAPATCGG